MLVITRRTGLSTFRQQTKNPTETPQFRLNRALERQSLSRAFRRKGRVQIPAILRPGDAQALYQCLSERTQWGLLVGSGPGIDQNYVSPEQCKIFTDAQHRTLHRMAHAFRRRSGSHLMGVRLIGHDAFERANDSSLLARFTDWLNSRAFLNFIRDITGAPDIHHVTVQAMRFGADHFASYHADATAGDHQRATCVFGLSPAWQRSWGGLLQFANRHGKLQDEFIPRFNSMIVFEPSMRHAVSLVTRQAQIPRYSIAASLFAEPDGGSPTFPNSFPEEITK